MPAAPKDGKPTAKEARFVTEYLIDLNAMRASIRAGYSARSAKSIGTELLARERVQRALAEAMAARAARTEIKQDEVLRRLHALATADTRDLIEYRRGCCRWCWGTGNRYQRTAGELERDRAAHAQLRRASRGNGKPLPKFDEQGGPGYHAKRDANPECPECFGDGVGAVVIRDTRNLSPEAAQLYAGVKQTRDGLEVRTHSQHEALRDLGRHLGLFKDKVEHTGADGVPLIPKKTDLTDDELAAIAAGRRS